ncbi:serine dehydratase-like [Oppia nitens]|uniref:serine dehydratase-like n=1 Tax=Oppia nitens TaxID=1686743 RepID=UPI0023D9A545|nr:serine dehydratase-like [Oppia nitens]
MSKSSEKDLFVRTPLIESLELAQYCPNRRVYLKLENCQPSGSFKMRGISRFCQQAVRENREEVISSSGGNAGLAAACSARLLGLKCHIIVPKLTTQRIIDKIAKEGADVEVFGNFWNDANEKALELVKNSPKSFYVHPFDNPILWTGHSTMIDEIVQDLDTIIPSMIVTCCGGGGLLCGIIEGMRRHNWTSVPVLAMETDGANSLNAAVLAGGQPVRLPAITSVATCLGSLIICDQLADDYRKSQPPVLSHLVNDKQAVDACIRFANEHRFLVEPACGASLAALYTGLVSKLFADSCGKYSDGPVVVIVCGGCDVTLDKLSDWKQQFNL